MLDYIIKKSPSSDNEVLETSLRGKSLLTTPQLNKGTAFTEQERIDFNILGKLPCRIETLDEQVARVYQQFKLYDNNLNKYIYLNDLHDTNQILFYKLVSQHISEMMPIIYTPTVGKAVKAFSKRFRRSRGLYIAYSDKDKIEHILHNRTNPNIDLIVITDGEGVLGIGDQGIGAMDIPIAKLMVYSLCGGIDPCRTLPICLDVGTNNPELITDPLYLGWSHPRLEGEEYDDFIEKFITTIEKQFPNAFLHWEDFGSKNARRLLDKYRERLCTFNDDIQGTGAVTLAAILAGIKYKTETLESQRFIIFGAGNAGMGITQQIYEALVRLGVPEEQAYAQFWLVDRYGLITDDQNPLSPAQRPFARKVDEVKDWNRVSDIIDLETTVDNVKPTILIGTSAVAGAFRENVIRKLCQYNSHPIILPLSNPNELCEATPQQLLEWSDGKALIATGSPFPDAQYKGQTIPIPQCNNAYVFPGIGLGVTAVNAKRLTHEMLWKATEALSKLAPIHLDNNDKRLLPSLENAKEAARQIAIALAKQAQAQNLCDPNINIEETIDKHMWTPRYLPFMHKSK